MATRKELLKLAAMANTLTSQMSTLATAIFSLIEQEEAVASAKLMDFPRTLKPLAKPTKARKVKRGGKRTKKDVAKADETPKVEEKK